MSELQAKEQEELKQGMYGAGKDHTTVEQSSNPQTPVPGTELSGNLLELGLAIYIEKKIIGLWLEKIKHLL